MAGHADGAEGLRPEFKGHTDGLAGGRRTAGVEQVSAGRLQTQARQPPATQGQEAQESSPLLRQARRACSRRCPLSSLGHKYCPIWLMRTLSSGHVPQCGSGKSRLARASVSPSGSHFCCLCSSRDWEAFNK